VEIAAWLRSLGLEQYEPAFRDNDIDAALVSRLTGDDLKDLGVTSVGHRRKLLDAIAELNKAIDHSDSFVVDPGPASAPPFHRSNWPRQPDAERRQLTILFCDLVGSTELSRRLDPEEYRGIIATFQQTCATTIARFDGFLAKYMGDGVLAYFGYPQAHEDEASRAVRAALALVQGVTRLELPDGLDPQHARVGIATGLVVVGDLIGAGSAQEQSVAGETPNLAARLQTLAPPDGVVIAASTRRLLGSEFDLAELGAQNLKGFPSPVSAWRVVGTRPAGSRFEALREGATPLIGRTEELGSLMRRWEHTVEGEGQVVLLSGIVAHGLTSSGRFLTATTSHVLVLTRLNQPGSTDLPRGLHSHAEPPAVFFQSADVVLGRGEPCGHSFRRKILQLGRPFHMMANVSPDQASDDRPIKDHVITAGGELAEAVGHRSSSPFADRQPALSYVAEQRYSETGQLR
jgi:class 3 adenylate cyclase